MKTRLLALLVPLLVPALGEACTIPVFRYALERWELSRYELTVFFERVLSAEVDNALKKLEAGTPKANLTINRVDLQGNVEPAFAKHWKLQGDKKTLPWMALRLPDSDARLPDAWAGPCTLDNLRRLVDSPVRQKLVEHLSRGTTAVFMLLPGNDESANAKAYEHLEKELARMAKLVQLPEQGPDGPQIRTGVPLKVEFSALKLNRNDPAEQIFNENLINSEEDLAKVRGPVVLPVFGRGRLLCSLYGQDLNKDNLKGVVSFLCGECSCQVKELNPGVDLLIAADWSAILEKAGPPMALAVAKAPVQTEETAPKKPATEQKATVSPDPSSVIVELTAAAPDASENVVVPPSVAAEEVLCHTCFVRNHSWLAAAVGGAALLVLVTGLWVFLQRK